MAKTESDIVEPGELTLDDGVFLVKLARKAIESYIANGIEIDAPSETPEKLKRRGMAFVTIERYSKGRELRGCIGFLQPLSPLTKTVISAAIAAATEDPRFPPLTKEELSDIVIEVSVLSMPKPIKNPNDVVIGRHGLVISRRWRSGTLLPQVPVEYCWDRETFLAECCLKAGFEPDCWLSRETKIYVYEAKVFSEGAPSGAIEVKDLEREYREKCNWVIG